MKTLYLDCFSGISGDMFIGALLDAGADPVHLREELSKLRMEDEYELRWEKVLKNGITCTKFDVILQKDNHLHVHSHTHTPEKVGHKNEYSHSHGRGGHEYAHSHEREHEHEHSQEHVHTHEDQEHVHTHEHNHTHKQVHGHDHHHHAHRSYKDIVQLIKASGFSEQVENTALQIFKKIGEAEGKIHGVPLDEVHFHEVGAVDSIIDIVGGAIAFHQLGIDTVISSPIPVGKGKIRIDHGIYPVPAPATLEMLRGIPIERSDIRGELTTPTGAALIAVLAEEFGSIPSMRIQTIGYGAGTKTFPDHPNALRVIIGE
ncbi:LarC family nickel insertion protein [Paenibacillus polygoni]|uniref:LarC family nickel insertion protein n=1 Tax=Paenibacillus polygoni TaxID=3050112 RepID=A0ABY8WZA5_9BACL|nr:LarC family nickel insertion protein [Paenibacillus polygoni]WIV17491.1 LarC family nickel insertion protein [Paenibacillus polygoni]